MTFKHLVFFLFFFSGLSSTLAQKKQLKNAPLKKVLFVLEKEYDVKFSFQDEIVEKKIISLNYTGLTFNEVINKLQNKTPLYFQKVTKRYIIISEKSKGDKNTACGYIVDLLTEQPLLGTTVVAINNPLKTVTNTKGYFQLKGIKEKDTLKIELFGYKPIIKPVTYFLKSPCVIVDLKEESEWLKEVLIENSLTDGFTQKADGSVIISPKKLGILPGLTEPDVLQSIQLLPGISSPNETASGLYIRGGTPDQNLILFDGIKMYNSAHFFGMISAFNPYITQKVSVFKNGASAKYGNHISGVIDIKTEDNINDKTSGGFGTNLTHTDAYIKIPFSKKTGVSISARKSFTGVIKTTTFNKLSTKVFQNSIITRNNEANANFFNSSNEFGFSDINAKIVADLSKEDKLTINYLFIKNELNYQFNSINKSYNTSDLLKTKNSGFRIDWKHKWNNNTSINTSIYNSNYNYDYSYTGLFIFNTIINQSAIKKNNIDDLNIKTAIETSINKENKLLFGYDFSSNKVTYHLERSYSNSPASNYQINKNTNNTTHAFFGEYILQSENKSVLQFGIRANHFSLIKKTFFAPRISAQIKLTPSFLVKSSLEYKQQNISQLVEFDTSDFGLENQVWVLADNDKVPVLKSNQITLGVVYNKNNWTLDLDFYRKNISGLTSFTRGFVSLNSDNLIGEGVTKGIDLLIKKEWKNYHSWISYSLSETKNTFKEINKGNPFSANFDSKHHFLWSHNLKLGNYNFSLGWNFRTGTPYTPAINLDVNDNVVYGEINSNRLPDYKRLDFSSTYSFSFDEEQKIKGKLGISLLNVSNRKNILKRTYEAKFIDNTNTYELNKLDNISLGFVPNLVFRVDF